MPARREQESARERKSNTARGEGGDIEKERNIERVDVQTELDTIRKSILRRWYAVKISLVSAVTL